MSFNSHESVILIGSSGALSGILGALVHISIAPKFQTDPRHPIMPIRVAALISVFWVGTNLIFWLFKNEDLYLIDFQDARLGLPFYDLVSLLEDCYYPLRHEERESLIKYYRENSPLVNRMPEESFRYWYNLSAIQRIFKALGSFSYISTTRGDDRYLKYVGVGVGRLLALLETENSLQNFYQLLKRTYHEN